MTTLAVTEVTSVAGVYKELGPWMYDVLIDIRGIREMYGIDVSCHVSMSSSFNTLRKKNSVIYLVKFQRMLNRVGEVPSTDLKCEKYRVTCI